MNDTVTDRTRRLLQFVAGDLSDAKGSLLITLSSPEITEAERAELNAAFHKVSTVQTSIEARIRSASTGDTSWKGG